MRTLALLLLFALCAVGPVLYLTRGAAARSERAGAVARLMQERAAVRALFADGTPTPSAEQNAMAAERLGVLEDAIRTIAQNVARASGMTPPSAAELRERARAAGIEDAIVLPLLEQSTGADAERDRRLALAAVIRAVASGRTQVRTLDIAGTSVALDRAPLRLLRIDVALLGPPADVVAALEHLVAGGPQEPCADIVSIDLHALPLDADRADPATAAPPVGLRATLHLLLGPREAGS